MRHVDIVARRGVAQAAFTNRELREVLQLADCNVGVNVARLTPDDLDAMASNRQQKRQVSPWRFRLSICCGSLLKKTDRLVAERDFCTIERAFAATC